MLTVELDASTAQAVAWSNNRLEVIAPRAYAPGQPASLAFTLEGTRVEVRAKSLGSRRSEGERFHVTLRLVDLRRAHREALARALAPRS